MRESLAKNKEAADEVEVEKLNKRLKNLDRAKPGADSEEQPVKASRLAALKKLGTLKAKKGRRPREPKEDRPSRSSQPSAAVEGPALRRAKNLRDLMIEPQ